VSSFFGFYAAFIVDPPNTKELLTIENLTLYVLYVYSYGDQIRNEWVELARWGAINYLLNLHPIQIYSSLQY
jgi:hypothetical protein